MKKKLAVTIFLLSNLAFGADLAVVMGRPSEKIAENFVKDSFDLIGRSKEDQSSTWAYSLLKQENVSKVSAIYILDDALSTTELLLQGLQLGAHKAPVVMTNVGPINHHICPILASYSNTAFVVIAGNDAEALNRSDYPSCAAGNILFVTSFDQETDTLMSFANYGSLVRLASPANEIKVKVEYAEEEWSGSTPAVTIVAARLANFARTSGLAGQKLILEFLKEKTIHVAELDGMVEEGRALAY